jgi:hypothetical protein
MAGPEQPQAGRPSAPEFQDVDTETLLEDPMAYKKAEFEGLKAKFEEVKDNPGQSFDKVYDYIMALENMAEFLKKHLDEKGDHNTARKMHEAYMWLMEVEGAFVSLSAKDTQEILNAKLAASKKPKEFPEMVVTEEFLELEGRAEKLQKHPQVKFLLEQFEKATSEIG